MLRLELVGGSYNSTASSVAVLRLNPDGTLDTGFNAGGGGANSYVQALALQADGKVLVGGFQQVYNGDLAAPDYLLRLNADGTLNNAPTPLAGATFVFNPGNTSGPTRTVTTAGTYTATATDPATGCTYTSNAVVVSTAAPAISSLTPSSSPVSGNRLSDLAVPGGFQPVFNPAYNTSAASASVQPFPTVLGYDPARVGVAPSSYQGFDQGYYSPASGSAADPVPDFFIAGRGYAVQLAANQTVDFVGPLIQAAVTLPLTRPAGNSAADNNQGWQLLGNPFASAFALASLDNTPGVDNAKYIFQSSGPYAGTYQAVLTGVTGQPLLAVGQGFFAHLNTPGTTATLTFALAGRRVDFSASAAFHRATEPRPLLELALTDADATRRDATTLYADARATAGFDPAYDAAKLANPHGLNLWQEAAGQALAVSGLPAWAAGTVVPLAVGVPAAGRYALQVERLLNLPVGTAAVLVDAELGTRTDLATLPAPGYAFAVTAPQAAAALRGRFWLNLVSTSGLASAAGPAALQLYPNPAHRAATLVGATPGQPVQVYDAVGRLVAAATADAAGTAGLALPASLSGGVYVVRVGAQALRLAVE